jgi:O-succinylbenzoate synthase
MAIALAVKPYGRRFRQPLRTAHGPWTWRRGAILQLQDDQGRIACGEIAPLPWFGSETLAAALDFCHGLGDQLPDNGAVPQKLPATQFAVGSALAALANLPPDPDPGNLDICGLLPAGQAGLERWQTLVAQGTRTLKWKIGVWPVEQELVWLEQLGQGLPSPCRLRLDANGGLTVAVAQRWLEACDRLNGNPQSCTVEYLEQPLPPSQFEAMQQLARQFKTAIALDESVATVAQLQACHDQGWPGVYGVKPAIAGHPDQLRQFWRQSAAALVFSSVFETVVGRRAALDLAVTYQRERGTATALGFGTLGAFADDWDTLTPEQLWQQL